MLTDRSVEIADDKVGRLDNPVAARSSGRSIRLCKVLICESTNPCKVIAIRQAMEFQGINPYFRDGNLCPNSSRFRTASMTPKYTFET